MSFLEYLNLKGIKQVQRFDSEIDYKSITEEQIKDQLYIISEFHKNVNGFKPDPSMRIESSIGKVLEKYKVNTKKIKKYYVSINCKEIKSEFEKFLLDEGNSYIERAEKSINMASDNNYMGLIIRSMRNKEICLGVSDFNNIRKDDGISIIDISKCCYNMVEMDGIYMLNKVKKINSGFDFTKLIDYYCSLENLDFNSNKYMSAMLSYPNEFIKCCSRYFQNKKQWDEIKYIGKLKKAMEQDGYSLI